MRNKFQSFKWFFFFFVGGGVGVYFVLFYSRKEKMTDWAFNCQVLELQEVSIFV